MTKEEVLNTIIEHYKNGSTSALSDYCDRVRCVDCPFNTEDCVDDVAMAILDRLLKAEEHQKAETNLEHYVAYYNNYDQCIYMDAVKLYNEAHRRLNNFDEAIEWLLEPYKPQKPKYKLNQFEYDLIELHSGSKFGFRDFWILEHMQDKGYFKGIPTNVPIKDILENCEVSD